MKIKSRLPLVIAAAGLVMVQATSASAASRAMDSRMLSSTSGDLVSSRSASNIGDFEEAAGFSIFGIVAAITAIVVTVVVVTNDDAPESP